MSELEAGRRAQNAQPISTSAITKIRGIGTAGQLAAQSDGLEDVFAQVFAHMTHSGSVESTAAADDGSDENLPGAENLLQANDEQRQPADDSSLSDHLSALVPAISEESFRNPSDDAQELPQSNGLLEDAVSEDVEGNEISLEELTPQETIEQLTVETKRETLVKPAVVEAEQSEAGVVDANAVETIIQASSDKEGGDRRHHGKGTAQVPDGPIVPEDSSRANLAEESQREVTQLGLDSDQSELGHQASSDDRTDRPRRSRGRRGGEHAVRANDTATQMRPSEEALLKALGSQNAAGGQANAAVESMDPKLMDAAANSTRQATPALGAVAQAAMNSARASASGTNGSTGGANGFGTVAAIDGKAAPAAANDRPNAKSTKANTAETVSRVKLIQRVSKAFQHLGPDGGTVRLRLAPAELGSVRVEMRIHQRKMQARVVAETEAAGTALREHLPELRQRLESQGLQIEKLEVEVDSGDREAGDFRHRQDNERQQSRWQSPSSPRKPATRPEASMAKAPIEVSQTLPAPISVDGVDIHL